MGKGSGREERTGEARAFEASRITLWNHNSNPDNQTRFREGECRGGRAGVLRPICYRVWARSRRLSSMRFSAARLRAWNLPSTALAPSTRPSSRSACNPIATGERTLRRVRVAPQADHQAFGKKVDCPRSAPSTKHLVRPPNKSRENHRV